MSSMGARSQPSFHWPCLHPLRGGLHPPARFFELRTPRHIDNDVCSVGSPISLTQAGLILQPAAAHPALLHLALPNGSTLTHLPVVLSQDALQLILLAPRLILRGRHMGHGPATNTMSLHPQRRRRGRQGSNYQGRPSCSSCKAGHHDHP